jgi:pre-mRNA-processing factor 17
MKASHRTEKYFAAQSLDNQILIYNADNFRQNRKKRFAGHSVAGYACQVGFSPDGRYVGVLSCVQFISHCPSCLLTSVISCSCVADPQLRWLSSGDGHGDMVFWDWKTGRIKSRLKCHSKVVIAHEWLEHETSKVVTASWDGLIKLWVRTESLAYRFINRC